jgi:hypothetical protein
MSASSYEDLAATTEALCARLREGDVAGAADLVQKRETQLANLVTDAAPSQAAETISRAVGGVTGSAELTH